MTSIRTFDPERDSGWVHAMWQETLSPLWSVSAAELMRRIRTAGISLVAERGGVPAGFGVASCNPANETAAISAVIVDPAHRRVGVGTALLEEVQGALGKQGTSSLALGYGGADEYFWPGVPENQCGAWEFFANRGWEPQERNFDLVVDLAAYRTPAWVITRLQNSGATLHFADAEAAASIVCFERANFPEWTDFFEETFARQKYRNVLYAEASGAVVGAVLLNADEPVLWSHALGLRCGSFGILGVARSQEGKGIGLALAARALDTVQQRGCSTCYIGWTGLVNWYAKLGATIWSEYRMSRKQLSLAAPHQDVTRVPVERSEPVLVERQSPLVPRTAALLAASVTSLISL